MDILDLIHNYLSANGNRDALKAVIESFLNAVMEEESKQQCGSEYYERNESRKNYRNGTRERQLKTANGTLTLQKPQLRDTPFHTTVFQNYSRIDESLKNAVLESYINGVSTRNVQAIVGQLGVDELSASSVSRISKKLDEAVDEFLKRPIEKAMPFVYVDATYCKIRDEGKYVSKALYIAVGVNDEGYREVLGAKLADCENEDDWSVFFEELKDRGLDGVKLVISDGHKGIRKAVTESFLGSSWQMCQVHFMRNVLKYIPQKHKSEVSIGLKDAMGKPEYLQDFANTLREQGYSNSANTIERFAPDILNYRAFPDTFWRRIRTTNVLERVNLEIKRRSKKVGAFPSAASFMRVAISILIDINEEWVTGKRYLTLEEE